MAEKKYTKKLVIETSDGQVTLEGGAARAMATRLDDASRYFHLTTAEGVETYYDVQSASCGFCKVATLTAGSTAAEAIACEDALPNCPNYVALNRHAATIKANGTVTLVAETHPADAQVTWTSSQQSYATVEGGVVTGVAAGETVITASITVDSTTYTDKATITVEPAE